MQGQEQFQGQIQNQFQKVKRLCVALSTKSILKKLGVALCKKVCKFKAELKLISNY